MKRLPRISRGRDRTKRRKVDYTARRRRRTRVMNAHIFKSFLLFVRDDISFDRPDGGIRVVTVTRAAMATALAHSIATVALPRAHPARSRLARAFRARVRVAASAGGDPELTPERRLQLEKADALREEYDGVSTRARRLLTRGSRLAAKIDELTAGAERAMTLGADRDENQARRLLRERAQVKEALDRTIARAEVLKELARKIELAIIVYAGEVADAPESPQSETLAEVDAPRAASGSLEAEFASLEINLLERAFAASDAESETRGGATKDVSTRGEGDARARDPERGSRAVPGWWQDAPENSVALEDEDEDERTRESGCRSDVEKPLDALLSLDRARVSSVGVRPLDAVRLRVACAAHGAENVAGSKRLEGGKRDTAFRAGIEAAVTAVEADEGRVDDAGLVEPGKALWQSLAGQDPLRFLSDLARDIGVRPARAGALVTEAIVRRVEKTLVRCAAHGRAGDWDEARRECIVLARTLVAFAAAAASPEERESVALVALRTQRQLREYERREVLALFPEEGGESERVREVIRLALGL